MAPLSEEPCCQEGLLLILLFFFFNSNVVVVEQLFNSLVLMSLHVWSWLAPSHVGIVFVPLKPPKLSPPCFSLSVPLLLHLFCCNFLADPTGNIGKVMGCQRSRLPALLRCCEHRKGRWPSSSTAPPWGTGSQAS